MGNEMTMVRDESDEILAKQIIAYKRNEQ